MPIDIAKGAPQGVLLSCIGRAILTASGNHGRRRPFRRPEGGSVGVERAVRRRAMKNGLNVKSWLAAAMVAALAGSVWGSR